MLAIFLVIRRCRPDIRTRNKRRLVGKRAHEQVFKIRRSVCTPLRDWRTPSLFLYPANNEFKFLSSQTIRDIGLTTGKTAICKLCCVGAMGRSVYARTGSHAWRTCDVCLINLSEQHCIQKGRNGLESVSEQFPLVRMCESVAGYWTWRKSEVAQFINVA